jgi:hypothetical protein
MTPMLSRPTRRIASAILAAGLAAVAAPTAVANVGQGGKPVVERDAFQQTLSPDEFLLDVCGVETNTTYVQRTTTKTFPDGSQTVQIQASWTPDDPNLASERDVSTRFLDIDGTETIVGLPIRLYRHGEGTIIRDAGWLRVFDDGLLVRGPHPFLETDPADVYC